MNSAYLSRIVIWLLVVVLVAGLVGETRPATPAHAQAPVPGVNAAVGFLNLLSMTNRRNQIYREAKRTQKEMDAYYDSLIATARSQLRNRELLGADQSQLAVYVKMIARLEQERAAATQQIEAEKNKARQDFNRSLSREITRTLMQSPSAQAILGQVRQTLAELRTAAEAIRTALNTGKPIETLVEKYASQVEKIPGLQYVVRQMGYDLGHRLDNALGGLLGRAEAAANELQIGMEQAIVKTNELDAMLSTYQQQERQPVSLIDLDSPLANVRPVKSANAAVDVAAQAFTNAALLSGLLTGLEEKQREPLRDRIREQLLQQRTERLQQALQVAGLVECTGVGRVQYELATQQLGRVPEQPRAGDSASYLVCIDRNSGLPILASLIGASTESDAKATEPAGSLEKTKMAAELTATAASPSPTATSVEIEAQATATKSPDQQTAELIRQCDAMDYITVKNGMMVGNETVGYAYQVEITNSHPELNIIFIQHLTSGKWGTTIFHPGTMGHPFCASAHGDNAAWSTDWIAAFYQTPECVSFLKNNTIDHDTGMKVIDLNYPACP